MKLTHSNSKKAIILNGTSYVPYEVCDLPNNFGCIEYGESDGVAEWFGYKGFTYIPEN